MAIHTSMRAPSPLSSWIGSTRSPHPLSALQEYREFLDELQHRVYLLLGGPPRAEKTFVAALLPPVRRYTSHARMHHAHTAAVGVGF